MPDITKISHGLTIGDLKFGNVRPGVVEATLKPGETMEQALDELDERLNAWHRKKYSHLYQDNKPIEFEQGPINGTLPIISEEKEPEARRIGVLVADIYSCLDIKTLETYKFLAKTKPELQAAYTQQLEKLSK